MHYEVVGPFQFGRDSQDRDQEPQIGGDGRLQQDLPGSQFLCLRVQGVDELVASGQHHGRFLAASREGLRGHGQVLDYHAEQLDDLALDGL